MDKINFENLPSTNTPLDADTLNEMQENIEKSVVAVGKTQPSTGENVWIKKGKNLLNKDKGFAGSFISSTGVITPGDNNALFFQIIRVWPNTAYTISCKQVVQNFAFSIYDENNNFITRRFENGVSSMTQVMPQNAAYMKVQFNYDNVTTITQSIIDSLDLMLVQGSTATTYEPYVEKEILVKNDNEAFDRFLVESDIPDIDTSRWTSTLLGYRYTNGNNVVYAGTVVASFSSGSVNFDITNLELAERPDTVQLTANSLRYPLRYDYDSSTATRLKIEVINNGSVYNYTGNVRFSITVYGKLA